MQKWEYCIVGPIKGDHRWAGHYPSQIFLTANGQTQTPIEGSKKETEEEVLAKTIAQMGMEGWELVAAGSVKEVTFHYLYFKRPVA